MLNRNESKGSRFYSTAVLLTFAGGYLDAYTYSCRGKVFANAQTGNIVKLGINLAQGNTAGCVRFLIPIIAFTIGILAAMFIESEMEKREIHFIRRTVLLLEIAVMILSAFLPQTETGDLAANTMISFVCAMQMEAFKVFLGQPFATTVSTGNLRKFIEFVYKGVVKKDREAALTGLLYLFIVLTFIFGAFVGTKLTDVYQVHSVAGPAVLLAGAFLIITGKQMRSAER